MSKLKQVSICVWISLLYWAYYSQLSKPFENPKQWIFLIGLQISNIHKLFSKSQPNPNKLKYSYILILTLLIPIIYWVIGRNIYWEGLLQSIELATLIFFIIITCPIQKETFNVILCTSFLNASLISFIGILAFKKIIPSSIFNLSYDFFPPIGHLTYAADFFALHIPIGIYLYNRADTNARRACITVFSIIIFWGLWLTGTRSAILALYLSLTSATALLLYQKKTTPKKVVTFTLLFITINLTTLWSFPNSMRGPNAFSRLLFPNNYTDSGLAEYTSDRSNIYWNTWKMIAEKPWFGWGPGSFRYIYPGNLDKKMAGFDFALQNLTHPHNEVLWIWSEYGGFGLIIAVIGLAILSKKYFQKLVINTTEDFDLHLLSLTGLLIIFISAQLSTSPHFPTTQFLGLLFIALLFIQDSTKNFQLSPQVFYKKTLALLFSNLLLFVTLGTVVSEILLIKSESPVTAKKKIELLILASQLTPMRFEVEVDKYRALRDEGDIIRAKKHLNRLMRYYPHSPVVLFFKAKSCLAENNLICARQYLEASLKIAPKFVPSGALLYRLNNP